MLGQEANKAGAKNSQFAGKGQVVGLLIVTAKWILAS